MNRISLFAPHYSMQNNPTVFDEEALTALEMCGRLGAKMNECINATNGVVEEVHTLINGYEVPKMVNVSPTGDVTGRLDRVIIQTRLDSGYSVHLSAGEYYLDEPLMFRAGYMLRGDSQLNTVLNCKAGFIDHDEGVSVDHIEVRDLRVKGSGKGVGIDISRKVEGVETGGRYAHFMNIYIAGYETAVRLGGCWCTNFTHCRIEGENICVEQRGSCNHIKYDHCIFLGPTGIPSGEQTCIGIKITADDGAENYGISVDHCDFERHEFAIKAYACVSLNVSSIYVEGTRKVFELDSCPGFLCDGGYISYPNRVCNTTRTNTSPVFSACNGAIKNLYVRVNRDDAFYLVSTVAGAPLNVEDINCVNDGVGECIINNQCANGIWNGHEHHLITETQTLPVDLKTSHYFFLVEGNDDVWQHNSYANKPGHCHKLQEVIITWAETVTPSQSVTLRLQVKGSAIGKDTNNHVTIMEAYLNAGETYSGGSETKFTFKGETYRDLMIKDLPTAGLRISASVSNFADSAKGKLGYTMASGQMLL